jgi:CRP-like cAMP-binding protein/Zn-dependent protease
MSSEERRPIKHGVIDGLWTRIAAAPRGRRRRTMRPGGLWRHVDRRADPIRFRPRLASDVEIKEFRLRWGNDYAMIRNPRDLIHYRLAPEEVPLVGKMDGTRTVKELVVEHLQGSGELDLDGVVELVQQLNEGGFLDPPYVDVYGAVRRALRPGVLRAKGREFLRTLSIDWSGADRFVRWLYRNGMKIFFTWPAVLLGTVLGAAGLVAFVLLVQGGSFTLSGRSVAGEFLILLALNYVLTFLHELGHALAIVHYGRKVKAAGFMVYFGSPAFFIEASDALMLERRQRIIQAFAGPFAELMVAGAASLFALAFPETPISGVLYKFAVLNYFVLSMNLIPLLELDGYWILSDLIQVPDLRPRSLAFVRHDLWHKLRLRDRFSRVEVGLALYGIVGVAFAAFSFYTGFFFWRAIFGSLIADLWDGGLVTRILLVALALLVAGPLVRGAIALGRALLRRIRAGWGQIRFRLERSWRVESARAIDALPIFEDLPVDTLNEVAGRVRLLIAARGQPIIRQGERADAFYVVRRGSMHVVEEDPEDGSERILRTLGAGESFGELGLLEAAPRQATVRAAEESQLFVIDKGTFDQLLADEARAPRFAPTVQAVAELRSLPPFAHLEAGDLVDLADRGEWITLPPGRDIVVQGQPGDAFYALASGQVEILRHGRRRTVLGPGSWFGEVALLLDVPRTATVRSRTPVRAFRLEREGFDRLVGDAFRRGTLNPNAVAERSQRH